MARTTTDDAAIMRECQVGLVREMAGPTGGFCRARDKCYAERRCYFVYRVEHYLEVNGGKWREPAGKLRKPVEPTIALRRRAPDLPPDRLLRQLGMEI